MATIPELLDGHITLEIECLDRLYLNGYIGKLATGPGLMMFMRGQLGGFGSFAFVTKARFCNRLVRSVRASGALVPGNNVLVRSYLGFTVLIPALLRLNS